MEQTNHPVNRRVNMLWWLCTLLFALAVVVDLQDNNPLKLVMSGLLFVGSLLNALFHSADKPGIKWLARMLMVSAVVIFVYRLVGPGL